MNCSENQQAPRWWRLKSSFYGNGEGGLRGWACPVCNTRFIQDRLVCPNCTVVFSNPRTLRIGAVIEFGEYAPGSKDQISLNESGTPVGLMAQALVSGGNQQ